MSQYSFVTTVLILVIVALCYLLQLSRNMLQDAYKKQAQPTEHADVPTFDLDKISWGNIKQAARKSKWIPPEYYANDWEYDVCEFLRNGHPINAESAENKKMTPAPEIYARVMRYAGKKRNQVSNPYITANEAITMASYIKTLNIRPAPPKRVTNEIPLCI